MGISVFLNGQEYEQVVYDEETGFEALIAANSETLFGNEAIYIDVKQRIGSGPLGGTIPDGMLLDLADLDNPEFYLVEVELQSHDFYRHIFPQITKFFAFFRNASSRQKLTEQIFSIFKADSPLREKLKKLIGTREIYKFLKDMLENSQNILIIIDGPKSEFDEIMDTYTDTWGRMVKIQIVNHFRRNNNDILTIEPPIQNLVFEDAVSLPPDKDSPKPSPYTEEFHLQNRQPGLVEIYEKLKRAFLTANSAVRFNPTKYYIGVIDTKQIAFITLQKKRIRLVVLMPENEVRDTLPSGRHNVCTHSDSVQRFWGGNNPNCTVQIADTEHWDEIQEMLVRLIEKHQET